MHKRVFGVILLLLIFLTALPVGQIVAESLNVSASVNASLPPNEEVPIVVTPNNNSSQTLQNIFITGTCAVIEPPLIVVLLRDNQIIGTGPCLADGTFKILVGLVKGKNIIIPKFVTITGQSSGFGQQLILFYDQPVTTAAVPTVSQPCIGSFMLAFDYDFITYNDTTLTDVTYKIVDGCGPYTVTINWGDGTQTTSKVTSNDPQTSRHQYVRVLPPSALTITVVDANGQKAVQSRALISFKKGVYVSSAQPVQKSGLYTLTTAQKIWAVVAVVSVLLLVANHFGLVHLWNNAHTAPQKKPGLKGRKR